MPLIISLERSDGSVSRYETVAFPDGHPQCRCQPHLLRAPREVPLWSWRLEAHHRWSAIGQYITKVYASDGPRKFDHRFMGEQVYGPVHRGELRR